VSRPRLPEGDARAEPRNGLPVAVEREGPSRTTADLETMLERAAPADVLRELDSPLLLDESEG